MDDEYLLINKNALPEYLVKVLKAKEIMEEEGVNVLTACKMADISRSTFYKYKNSLSNVSTSGEKRAILSFKVDDKPGVLSSLLNVIYNVNCNIVTINMEMPINKIAYIHMTINFSSISISLDELINEFKGMKHVRKAEVLGYE